MVSLNLLSTTAPIVQSAMDDPPMPSGPSTIADNWVSVSSVCELVFRDFDPDAANNGWIQSPAAVRISDLLKPDALDCPFCSSVKLSIPIELRGRHDLGLEIKLYENRQKILQVMYTYQRDSKLKTHILRECYPESC